MMKKLFFVVFMLYSSFACSSTMITRDLEVGCYVDARDALKDIKKHNLTVLSDRIVISGSDMKESRLMVILDKERDIRATLILRDGQACLMYSEPNSKYATR